MRCTDLFLSLASLLRGGTGELETLALPPTHPRLSHLAAIGADRRNPVQAVRRAMAGQFRSIQALSSWIQAVVATIVQSAVEAVRMALARGREGNAVSVRWTATGTWGASHERGGAATPRCARGQPYAGCVEQARRRPVALRWQASSG